MRPCWYRDRPTPPPRWITDLAGLERLGIAENDLNIMRFSDFGVGLYGHCILTTPEFAAKNPDAVKKVVKGIVEAWKTAIVDPAVSIAAIKKREPLVDEKVERGRLELVIKNAIVTDRVRREGLSAVDPERMKETIEMVAKTSTFRRPTLPRSTAPSICRRARSCSSDDADKGPLVRTNLPHDEKLVGIEIVRQQLASVGRDQNHILVLHPEAETGFVDQRLDAEHHAGLERAVVGGAEVGILVQMQTDAVADEGNRRQCELADLGEIELINRAARRTRFDGG